MPQHHAQHCSHCHRPAGSLDWRCRHCEGHLTLPLPRFDPQTIRRESWSLARYEAMFPVTPLLSLGEGGTPLVETRFGGESLWVKLEFMAPTSSYKDRGTALLISHLAQQPGVEMVMDDSSGNAGVSLAAYAAKAGLRAKIFVPEHASASKKQQIATFGAELMTVPGPRTAANQACIAAQNGRATYASHAWSPYFLAGQMTFVWEVWEQMGQRLPEAILCAVGQGSLLLGVWYGCQALQQAGLLTAMPRLYAVQTTACAPVVRAWTQGSDDVTAVSEQATIAEGVRIPLPVRGRAILTALRESGGAALAVEDEAIRLAQRTLAQQGIFIEPTSAVPLAAVETVRRQLGPDAKILVPLTGSGLKTI